MHRINTDVRTVWLLKTNNLRALSNVNFELYTNSKKILLGWREIQYVTEKDGEKGEKGRRKKER